MDRREALRLATMLLGGALSASCTRALLSGGTGRGTPATPALDAAQLRQVSRAAERIIPRTDTPGAIDAGVPDFIHRIVAEWYTTAERATFLDGLAALDRDAHERFGRIFADLGNAEQDALLAALESPVPPRTAPAPIFAQLKELTVLGYYTSEVGAAAELIYRPLPGQYRGDALFHEHGKQWQY